MGQHLHLYASKAVTSDQAAAWCSCRCDELWRMPDRGFEALSFDAVSSSMASLRDTFHHIESGSTWAVQVWPRLWWNAYVITPELIEQCVKDAEFTMLWNENLPFGGARWIAGPEIQFLREHIGYTGWGDNDGI
jgi:hypothetical protein